MKAWRAIAALVAIVVAGCVSANDPAAVAKGTSTAYNPHTGLQEISGAPSPINGNVLQGMFNVRSFRNASGLTVHQVYLSVLTSSWLFLDSAYAYGQRLDFVAIDRAVLSCGSYGCTMRETVGINFTGDDLKKFAQNGFTFQMQGQRGSRVVTIPATYFQGYISKISA